MIPVNRFILAAFSVSAIFFSFGCTNADHKGAHVPPSAPAAATKPAPKPAGDSAIGNTKDTALLAAEKREELSEDFFSGRWYSKNTSMTATFLKSKPVVIKTKRGNVVNSVYYTQFGFGSDESFSGYYRLTSSHDSLVCDAYVGDYTGQLENEYIRHSSFKKTVDKDGKPVLVFACDACETTILHKVE